MKTLKFSSLNSNRYCILQILAFITTTASFIITIEKSFYIGNLGVSLSGDNKEKDTGEPFLFKFYSGIENSTGNSVGYSNLLIYNNSGEETTITVGFKINEVSGTWIKSEAIPEEAQGNWDEIDTKKASYIKNRPFGELSIDETLFNDSIKLTRSDFLEELLGISGVYTSTNPLYFNNFIIENESYLVKLNG